MIPDLNVFWAIFAFIVFGVLTINATSGLIFAIGIIGSTVSMIYAVNHLLTGSQ